MDVMDGIRLDLIQLGYYAGIKVALESFIEGLEQAVEADENIPIEYIKMLSKGIIEHADCIINKHELGPGLLEALRGDKL